MDRPISTASSLGANRWQKKASRCDPLHTIASQARVPFFPGIGPELRQVELYGAGEIKAKWGLSLGEIAMTNDMFLIVQGASAASCFGSCNFVKHWLGKVDGIERAHLGVEMCDQCQGLFSSGSSLLSQIKVGAQDKMQQTILQVYLAGEDYRIYRTCQGVYVNFADCRLRERKQRKNYAEVSDRLCNLRFLTSQLAQWWPSFIQNWLQKSGGFYDHQIAEAIHLALQETWTTLTRSWTAA
jgi:hypothetical protein